MVFMSNEVVAFAIAALVLAAFFMVAFGFVRFNGPFRWFALRRTIPQESFGCTSFVGERDSIEIDRTLRSRCDKKMPIIRDSIPVVRLRMDPFLKYVNRSSRDLINRVLMVHAREGFQNEVGSWRTVSKFGVPGVQAINCRASILGVGTRPNGGRRLR